MGPGLTSKSANQPRAGGPFSSVAINHDLTADLLKATVRVVDSKFDIMTS